MSEAESVYPTIIIANNTQSMCPKRTVLAKARSDLDAVEVEREGEGEGGDGRRGEGREGRGGKGREGEREREKEREGGCAQINGHIRHNVHPILHLSSKAERVYPTTNTPTDNPVGMSEAEGVRSSTPHLEHNQCVRSGVCVHYY